MTDLAALGIVTRDLAESARFYRELGLEVPEPRPDDPHFEITLPNGRRLMWDTVELIRQIDPDWEEPRGHRMGLAFECDVDAVHAHLVGAGFESKAEPWDAFWGQRYARVFDPDGNVVDLFRPL
jgi:catechol 2,3-dioxygenase-like lactoylglutathione lyase family enzyme